MPTFPRRPIPFALSLILFTACGASKLTGTDSDGGTNGATDGGATDGGAKCHPQTCTLACPNGFAKDTDGCDRCACAPISCEVDCDCSGSDVCSTGQCVASTSGANAKCCHPVECAAPPATCHYKGGSCTSCGELLCDKCPTTTTCTLDCPNGFTQDDNGCDKCECAPDNGGCICPENVDPVCGEDGKTYNNSCAMDCRNVDERHAGACGTSCPAGRSDLCKNGEKCLSDPKSHLIGGGECVPADFCYGGGDCPHGVCDTDNNVCK